MLLGQQVLHKVAHHTGMSRCRCAV